MVSTLILRNHSKEYTDTETVREGGPPRDDLTGAPPTKEELEFGSPQPPEFDRKHTGPKVPVERPSPRERPSDPDSTSAQIESTGLAEICRCEVIEVRGDDVLCWVEVAAGLRVKTSLRASLFDDLRLEPGVEFCWSARYGRVFFADDEDEELAREIERLNREWHHDLKYRELFDSDE